ncbi:MAG: DUF72 domain-containing protein [Planctomycetota bacterium]
MRRGGRRPDVRIGTSGYQYRHWRGLFYPADLPTKGWFAFFSRRFDTVEINNTFYRLPEPGVFDAWRAAAPRGFCFALKYSRYGSHLKHLQDPAEHIGLFLDRARRLGPHLGPVLVQLPPRWRVDTDRLDAFLRAAPRDVRWAVEFRHASWLSEPVFRILRKHRAALCIHDQVEHHPRELTAGWTYLRYHGRVPDGNYTDAMLAEQAAFVNACVRQGLDVYAYFNNDLHGHALRNAAGLRERVPGRAAATRTRR